MKKIIFILLVFLPYIANAQYFDKLYKQGYTQQQKGLYYKAIKSYNAAILLTDDKAKITKAKNSIEFCANKLENLRITAQKALKTAEQEKLKAENALKVAELEKKNAQNLVLVATAREQMTKNPTLAIRLAEKAFETAPINPPAIQTQRVLYDIYNNQ